jgi:RNA polymerase sigma factor (TIGR02999 family)
MALEVRNSRITELLQAHQSGNAHALDELIPLVYDQLIVVARNRMRAERNDHTLCTREIVHEAYLRMIDFDRIDWKNRYHFFGIASQVMRNILVNYAIRKNALKRGGDLHKVTLGEREAEAIDLHELLSVHHAMERLGDKDERQMRVVECRYFGGLTIEETSRALDISEPTVSRDWNMARAWLNRELNK